MQNTFCNESFMDEIAAAPSAISNAVFDAVGVRLRSVPFTGQGTCRYRERLRREIWSATPGVLDLGVELSLQEDFRELLDMLVDTTLGARHYDGLRAPR